MKLSKKVSTIIGMAALFGMLTVPAMAQTTLPGSSLGVQYGSGNGSDAGDQDRLRDGSCLPAVEIVPPALAADRDRDRTQDKAQDGSCIPAVEIVTPALAADRDRDRTQDKAQDGSCIPAVEIVTPTLAGDQDRTRDQKKDDSCLPAVEIIVPTLAGNGRSRSRSDCDCIGNPLTLEPVTPTLAADQLRDRDRDQDKLKDGSCLDAVQNDLPTLADNGNGRSRGDCDGTGDGDGDRDGSCQV